MPAHASRTRPPLIAAVAAAAAAGLVALAIAPGALAEETTQSAGSSPKPTVVLVHGAFADASGWGGVAKRLQDDGYTVIAPANPLRGLPQDATYVSSVLANIDGPVVLVGHSYGGAVITQAAAGNPNIKALVYIAAMMPDNGENLAALTSKFSDAQLRPALRPAPFSNADGTSGYELTIDPVQFRAVFAADVPSTQARIMAASQRPISASAFGDSATAAAWRDIPSWALVAKQDKTLGAQLERFEAERAGSHTVEIDSSHVPMVSHPGAVTSLIESAARSTSS
ncbi:alpha/beta fold hydrolase [Streptomyces sp. NPDC052023]|uniref:alpha/beta fold hydrolase n=1 Tax=Streptomyces sp. NPDC052023 TaxID=3365681 RepID=UPI0037CFB427